MTTILNLPFWDVLNVEETQHDYHVLAEYQNLPETCPLCGVLDPKLRKFGTKKQLFMDLPVHAKRVGIKVKRQRFECLDCGGKFYERLPDVDESHAMTTRLLEYIKEQSLIRTFTSIADDVGIHERTVRRIFSEYVAVLDENIKYDTPKWLGIDELKLIGSYRCVISNVEANTIVDLLPKRTQPVVASWFFDRKDRDKIDLVTMDMWGPYRNVVRDLVPNALIVVDKFHVVRMANDSLDSIRKALKSELTAKQRRTLKKDRFILLSREGDLSDRDRVLLSTWKGSYPELATAHDVKEGFYDIWDSNLSSAEAKKEFLKWKKAIPESIEPAFKPLLTAIGNWSEEVFNYFEYPITNAYTEALNGIMKLVNRTGRGYSFNALRAKILYSYGGFYQSGKPPFDKDYVRRQLTGADIPDSIIVEMMEEIIGVPFSTLMEEWEEKRKSQKDAQYYLDYYDNISTGNAE